MSVEQSGGVRLTAARYAGQEDETTHDLVFLSADVFLTRRAMDFFHTHRRRARISALPWDVGCGTVIRMLDSRDWTDLIRSTERAVLLKIRTASASLATNGWPHPKPSDISCVMFDRLDEAQGFCEAKVQALPHLLDWLSPGSSDLNTIPAVNCIFLALRFLYWALGLTDSKRERRKRSEIASQDGARRCLN